VIAAELVCGCQGLDVRPGGITGAGRGTTEAYALVRSVVAPLDADRPPADDVARVADLVAAGAFNRLLSQI
jgi:histidine ammonia-lyase